MNSNMNDQLEYLQASLRKKTSACNDQQEYLQASLRKKTSACSDPTTKGALSSQETENSRLLPSGEPNVTNCGASTYKTYPNAVTVHMHNRTITCGSSVIAHICNLALLQQIGSKYSCIMVAASSGKGRCEIVVLLSRPLPSTVRLQRSVTVRPADYPS